MLTLNSNEKIRLENYKNLLDERFPGLVRELIIFGSKARGDAREDSDLDVLMIIKEGDWRFKDKIADMGDEMAIGTHCVPTILIYTEAEKDLRIQRQSSFFEVVQQEGVSVR